MSSAELLQEAESSITKDPQHAERLYKQILDNSTGVFSAIASMSSTVSSHIASAGAAQMVENAQSQNLRDQETALLKLGELYRDQKSVDLHRSDSRSLSTYQSLGMHRELPKS